MIDETAEEIRELQTHSSSVVAVKAARALQEVVDREFATVEEYERALERNSNALRRANPSHASLQTTQREILEAIDEGQPGSVEEAKELTRDAIEKAIKTVENAKSEAASNLADRLEDGMTILTHDYSTTVLQSIEKAIADGKSLSVFITEARPRYLGRKTARQLASMDNVDPTLVVDSAAGFYLSSIDEVIVGMDCIVNDDLYNRVGTYPIAATASDQDVPFTVVGSSAKIVASGFRFENDFRAVSEVIREPPEGFNVANPGYDATPVRLIDNIVTDEGVKSP
ncbi:MAG: translation initiation factor eIF-2B [Halobacteriaceae archaeon]